MIEIWDNLAQQIRVVWPSKAKAWVTHNKLTLDENGIVIKGRYIELERIVMMLRYRKSGYFKLDAFESKS